LAIGNEKDGPTGKKLFRRGEGATWRRGEESWFFFGSVRGKKLQRLSSERVVDTRIEAHRQEKGNQGEKKGKKEGRTKESKKSPSRGRRMISKKYQSRIAVPGGFDPGRDGGGRRPGIGGRGAFLLRLGIRHDL